MKKLVIITLTIAATLIVGRSVLSPSVRAQSVESASKDLATTQADLRNTITTAGTKAQALQEHLSSTKPAKALPTDVQDFLKTTQRLEHLRDELREDIDHLETATSRTFLDFDHERGMITDPIVRHAMTGLRTQARNQTRERLSQARAALNLLNRVLVQGSDVAHAARCVQLADELNVHGQTVDERVQTATDEAEAYGKMTTELLARLATPYND